MSGHTKEDGCLDKSDQRIKKWVLMLVHLYVIIIGIQPVIAKVFIDRNKRFSYARQNVQYYQIYTEHFKNPLHIMSGHPVNSWDI